jgi:hypothetical protein
VVPDAGNEMAGGEGREVREEEWASDEADVLAMQNLLEERGASDRRWRLFACAVTRGLWDLTTVPLCRHAVQVAELYADGLIDRAAAAEAQRAAESVAWPSQEGDAPYTADYVASRTVITEEGGGCVWLSQWIAGMATEVVGRLDAWPECEHLGRLERQVRHLRAAIRDIFGDPFRPPLPISGEVQTWNGGTVPALARAAYSERTPEGRLDPVRLAVLADGLEEAGHRDAELLAHLRGPGSHWAGCHAVDHIMGRDPAGA